MPLSVLDMFTIGVGPSSSHTVGPMRAARRFACTLAERALPVARLRVELFGSLGHTGKGHGSDRAVLLGLEGESPEGVDVDTLPQRAAAIAQAGRLWLLGAREVAFEPARDLVFHRKRQLPAHPNGMRFRALGEGGELLLERVYYSVGGGFVTGPDPSPHHPAQPPELPHPFASAAELLALCRERRLSVSSLMRANELALHDEAALRRGLADIWQVMRACVKRGCEREGVLPGGLHVRRRAPALLRRLQGEHGGDAAVALDWLSLFALAVNEENAAGGRVVTAPTNGAAGIIPAVLHYHERFYPDCDQRKIEDFLLTAAAIGMLYKRNASISGAEVGCQGEVGVACSMAAGALAELLGGTPAQVEEAAEIGMEHHLGLTCDPVGGLVQVPCIERNAMGAVKALSAARLALRGDGDHRVSLDRVIATMRQTGADMKTKYKETARGGLALNVIEC